MKNRSLLLLLLLAWAGLAAYVWLTAPGLPERVATHFGANGAANGWMTRSAHVRWIVGFGVGVSAFMMGIFALVARLGGRGLNIPNKDYWLAEPRRAATLAFLERQGVLLAVVMTAFFALIHRSILLANARSPAALPMAEIAPVSGALVVFIVGWTIWLLVRFGRTAP